MAKKTQPVNETQSDEISIPILNGSGQYQEIHYMDGTVTVSPGDKHDLFLSRINRAELSRIKNIFTEIVPKEDLGDSSAANIAPPENPDYPGELAG